MKELLLREMSALVRVDLDQLTEIWQQKRLWIQKLRSGEVHLEAGELLEVWRLNRALLNTQPSQPTYGRPRARLGVRA